MKFKDLTIQILMKFASYNPSPGKQLQNRQMKDGINQVIQKQSFNTGIQRSCIGGQLFKVELSEPL